LDLNQVTQLLTWLDEEHRKDKALLMQLQSRIETQKAQLTEQARQFQEIQAVLARIEGQLPKVGQLESSIQGIRTEFANLAAKQTAVQEVGEEKRTVSERQESEALARIIRQVQERVEALGSYENTITALRDEDSNVRSELTAAISQLAEVTKRAESHSRRIDLVEQASQVLRDSSAEARLALADLNNQTIAVKTAADAIAPRLEAKIESLQAALDELAQRRRTDLDVVHSKQHDQARLIEELGNQVQVVQAPMARWTTQMEDFASQFERNRQTMYQLRELERQVRQQGKEVAEVQRLAVERQRAELREWQDNQTRVDEQQSLRLDQLEAWRPKASEALDTLGDRLDHTNQDIETRSDQLWQAWAEYSKAQIELGNHLAKQRGKSKVSGGAKG
jgi:chromosome segregation ATPase